MFKLGVLWFNMDFTCVLRWPNLHSKFFCLPKEKYSKLQSGNQPQEHVFIVTLKNMPRLLLSSVTVAHMYSN